MSMSGGFCQKTAQLKVRSVYNNDDNKTIALEIPQRKTNQEEMLSLRINLLLLLQVVVGRGGGE